MEENFKSKLGFCIFAFIILFLSIGGYFFMQYAIDYEPVKKEEKKNNKSLKIDEDKEYIYFTDDEIISKDAEIYYKNVVINLNTQSELNKSLKDENEIYKKNIKYISDKELIDEEICKYNNDNLYTLTFRNYKTFEYSNYVSLLINDFNYDCFDSVTFNKTKAYTFDTKSGKLLDNDSLLKKYNTNMDEIKKQIKDKLNNIKDDGEIQVDETINNLNNYALYINNYGELYITYLVKTTEVDYNDDMEVNS